MSVDVEKKIEVEEYIEDAKKCEAEGRFFRAKSLYKEILEQEPRNVRVLMLLGLLNAKRKQFDNAISFVKKAIEISPCAVFYIELGKIYIDKKDFYNAILSCKEAILLNLDDYDAWFYLAFALKENKQVDDAIMAYQKALLLNPDSASVCHNLGNIYNNIKNDTATTIEYYKKFLEYYPNEDEAKSALGTLYLKMKDYKEGWRYLEFCINKSMAIADRNSAPNSPTKLKPVWQGEDIKDKTIYIYYDGGLGDTIMFARFLPLLKTKCKKILFRCQTELVQLFKDSDFDLDVFGIEKDESVLEFDVHLPIMSLPHKFKVHKEEEIPYPEGYLKSDSKKIEAYRKKYFEDAKDKFKIGIKWQGNINYNQTRHFCLESYFKLLDLPNTKFYSLQKGLGIEQLTESENCEIVDLGSTFNDFTDTAAAIENLDLVITVDTAVAHLAGALGKKCWVLLPFTQDWRWSVDISYCPWYKSLRLFKQKNLGNWDEVFDEVHSELVTFLGKKYFSLL